MSDVEKMTRCTRCDDAARIQRNAARLARSMGVQWVPKPQPVLRLASCLDHRSPAT